MSLFTGVGGFDLGFERAGIDTVLQVEQDRHCRQVLERHWPNVERQEDVRDVDQWWAHIDLVYGGFPCQDVSVAGARAGLAGDRSGLWFEFERIVSELRPRWAVIENVPGLLSSNGGRDFAYILAGLEQLGFDAAWAILDSQYFGVPQRRRRVFIVGGPRGRGAEHVLSICESCGGNPETGREAREGTTGALSAGTLRAGGVNGGNNPGGGYLGDIANALDTRRGGADDNDAQARHLVAAALLSPRGGWSGPRGDGSDNLIYPTIDARQGKGANSDVSQAPPLPTPAGVRRLTPRECERLQGFPDDWTAEGTAGRVADSHRYRMMGNAVTVPVAEWIGKQLVAVDAHYAARGWPED